MSKPETIRPLEPAVALDTQWARIGGGFTVAPAHEPVDLERLIVDSATAAPHNARLFWVLASWMAVHHKLIDVRRLGRLLEAMPDTLWIVARCPNFRLRSLLGADAA